MIAVSATLIFGSLPWIILSARSAAPDIMFLSTICLVAAYVWLSVAANKSAALLALSVTAALLLYIPGLIWFLVIALILWRGKLADNSKLVSKWNLALAAVVFILLLAPLIIAIAGDPKLAQNLVLLPESYPSVLNSAKSLIWGALSFIWGTRDTHPMILGKLPLLNISVIALSFFGAYIMWKRARAEAYGIFGLILLAILVYCLNQDISLLSLAIPSFGILMAAGLRYLYAEWRSVFPLNPLPKVLALVLIASLVALNMVFGVRYALAAWPNSVPTKTSYVLK